MKFKLTIILLLFVNILCIAEITFDEQLVVPDAWNGRHFGDYWLVDNDGDGIDELFVCYRSTDNFHDNWYLVEYSLDGDTLSVMTQYLDYDVTISSCRLYKTEDTDYLIVVCNRELNDIEVYDLKIYDFATMELIDSHSNYNFFTEFGNEFDTNYIELAEDNGTTYLYLGLTYGYDTYWTRDEMYYTTKMVKYTFDEGNIDIVEEVEGCGKDMIYCSATEPIIAMGYSMSSTWRSHSDTINRVFHDYPSTVEELVIFSGSGDPKTQNLTKNDHHYQDYGMIIYEVYNHQFHCYSPDLSEVLWEDSGAEIGYYGIRASTCVSAQEGDHFLLNFLPFSPNDYLEIRDRTNGDVLLTQEVDFSPSKIDEGSDGELYFSYYEDDFLYVLTLSGEINVSNDSGEIAANLYELNNFPNPFNPTTEISYSIPADDEVEIAIFNVKGQKIKTLVSDRMVKGKHSVVWDGEDKYGKAVSSGVYFTHLKTSNQTITKRIMLIK